MALGVASGCWKGITHALPATGEDLPRRKRIIIPPSWEEYSMSDVVIGLGVGLDIGAEDTE